MTPHPSLALISRYADRTAVLDEVTMWSVEVHLESCAPCRALVAAGAPADDLLARVAAGIGRDIAAGPAPVRHRRWSAARNRWFVGQTVPWLIMTVFALLCALGLQALQPDLPSLVLLLAPVAPLPGVAVAWSRRYDPAWELIAGTPAAGLAMLLRRTAAVLAVVVPVLALLGAGSGSSPAMLLLPCLAFTAASIAVGAFIGVRLAALSLAAVWALAVVLPTVLTADLPLVLQPESAGVWALVTVALAGLAATRSRSFRWLNSHH